MEERSGAALVSPASPQERVVGDVARPDFGVRAASR
jgi:hypothetical protein